MGKGAESDPSSRRQNNPAPVKDVSINSLAHVVLEPTFPIPKGWKSEAICTDMPPGYFYPATDVRNNILQKICDQCPVQDICTEVAVVNLEYGFWGRPEEVIRAIRVERKTQLLKESA